jgi:hypothetical protein
MKKGCKVEANLNKEVNMNLTIDETFRDLIPPLAVEERNQLEENIVKDGCRDPIVTWHNIIIDGHNRYEICTRRNIEFTVHTMEFADRDEAMDWIDNNQLGRRNLTPIQMSLLRGRIYNRAKKADGGTGANQHKKQVGQNDPPAQRTSQAIADRLGVAEVTVRRDGRLAGAVETLKTIDPEIERKVVTGKTSSRESVIKAASVSKDEPERARNMIQETYTPKQERPVTTMTGQRIGQLREAANCLASHLQLPQNQWSMIEIRNWMRTLKDQL